MATIIIGRRSWGGSRDERGHREYTLATLIEGSYLDGPANVLATPGLPLPGSQWAFDADLDLWAFCKFDATVKMHQHKDGDPHRFWTVEQTFTTDPPKLCVDAEIADPLLEPPEVSGGFTKYTEEATFDRFGRPVTNSAHEQIKGPTNEWDANRMTIRVKQNVATLYQAAVLPALFIDRVNSYTIWGFPRRTVKLSSATWEKKFHGQCHAYYTRSLEFDINYYTFDRNLLDEGTKVLHGHWQTGTLTGAGCTLTLTTGIFDAGDDGLLRTGVIVSATVAAGGTNYPKNASFSMTVLGGVGTGGVVMVRTDALGVVTSVVRVVNGGYNYPNGTTSSTIQKSRWLLDTINGTTPNALNPSHFDRYKDKKEENARVTLDGAGCPFEGAPPLITTCSQCPGSPAPNADDPPQGGASRVWRVRGNIGAFTGLNVLIQYISGCSWQGVSRTGLAGGLAALTFNDTALGGTGQWQLTQSTAGEAGTWVHVAAIDGAWKCYAGNTLRKLPFFTETVTVSPAAEISDAPGYLNIQIYGEANLLLLGVPIDF